MALAAALNALDSIHVWPGTQLVLNSAKKPIKISDESLVAS